MGGFERGGWGRLAVAALLGAAVLVLLPVHAGQATGPTPLENVATPLERAEHAWRQRDRGHDGRGRADPDPVAAAIRAYEAAVEASPDDLGAHAGLIRALFFAGDYAYEPGPRQRDAFARAVDASREGLAAVARRTGLPDVESREPESLAAALNPGLREEVAPVYFWSAIAWGVWGRDQSVLAIVREGVANRIYRYAQTALALEPEVENGGPHRLLARLHATLPRVPFLTGFVDRDLAFPELELADSVAPGHPGTRLLLAMTLLDLEPERRDEALALLEDLSDLAPAPGETVEDLAIRQEARDLLASLRSESGS